MAVGADGSGYHQPMMTLIIGGARSGKSDLAQRLAAASAREVLFVATMQPGDDELRARIEAHRATRPPEWRTIEAPLALADALARSARSRDYVVIDCITLWVTNVLLDSLGSDIDDIAPHRAAAALADLADATAALAAWCAAFPGEIALVTNEAGAGVVPAYPLGRIFRDALGATNATLAASADRTLSVTAGLVVDLTALGARPVASYGPEGAR